MSRQDLVRIDGSHGEGGGQIVRTAVALSALTGRPLLVVNVRAGRSKPGLRAQHLAGVKAMQRICGARVRGGSIGSPELLFEPGPTRGGDYLLDVAAEARSAGSVLLVFQTLLPALTFAEGGSRLTIRGGTHVAWSPPYQSLAEVFVPTVANMGVRVGLELSRWGWYPRGGGEVLAAVEPVRGVLSPLRLEEGFVPGDIEALSASSNLPAGVGERQRERLLARLAERGFSAECSLLDSPAEGPGSLVFIKVRDAGGRKLAGFSALGERGKPAERVADEAADGLFEFLDRGGAVEEHLADQLVPYMALAGGESCVTTSRVSRHLLTNIWVVESFLGPVFSVEGDLGRPGRVVARGVGLARAGW